MCASWPSSSTSLHFHLDYLPFSLFSRLDVPFVTTFHGQLDLAELQAAFNTFRQVPVISISDSQRRPLPQANWRGTIYHRLPGNLLVAQLPLRIAAKIDQADREYVHTIIEPLLSEAHVGFLGEIGERDRSGFSQVRWRFCFRMTGQTRSVSS